MLLCNLMNIATHLESPEAYGAYAGRFRALLARTEHPSERSLLQAYCVPRQRLQEARNAALLGRVPETERLLHEELLPLVRQSGNAEWRFHLWVEVAGMRLRLGQFGPCLESVAEARDAGPVGEDRERAYALGWMEVLACHGWRNESLFDSRSRPWGNRLRAGQGRHWPSERALLQGLRKTLFLDGPRRAGVLEALRRTLLPQAAHWRWPARHLDLLGWLDRAIAAAAQRA
jgi:hypothetical protein